MAGTRSIMLKMVVAEPRAVEKISMYGETQPRFFLNLILYIVENIMDLRLVVFRLPMDIVARRRLKKTISKSDACTFK